jgi:hypothetical protein
MISPKATVAFKAGESSVMAIASIMSLSYNAAKSRLRHGVFTPGQQGQTRTFYHGRRVRSTTPQFVP